MSIANTYQIAIQEIKHAILRSRYRAAVLTNGEMLALYFRIGGYISYNSREGKWGTNAIKTIAAQLQKELSGLRGFSVSNMKNMRLFFEEWSPFLNSSVATGELQSHDSQQIALIRHLPSDELKTFLSIGFTHHCEIFTKAKEPAARLFYIQKCATEFWSVEKLRYHLKSDLYGKQGTSPNNFATTISNDASDNTLLRAFVPSCETINH